MTEIVIVDKSKCNPASCGYVCMRFCPRNKAGDECIVKDEGKVKINEDVCIGCNICVKKCPFGALKVVRLPVELNEEPVHQYGPNAFRLYGLPLPHKGMIIGLLGPNGIGKSTALQILSGELMPNLGKFNGATKEEVLARFQGSEAYAFLKDSFEGRHKVAYKPQYVESIPKAYDGKVRDLLKKTGNNYEEVAKELMLTSVLDTDIKNVSGGELQRIAIAAALLKDANTYFFDEPSSYLDIKQRLLVAQKLNSLKGNVFIVEHDLIMLDYMTDYAHIFYGERGAYGITSYPYTTREAINAYLKGYLPNENIRFRDKPISYDMKKADNVVERDIALSWGNLTKSMGRFSLTVNAGELFEGEVVGIIGANGTGKTTFARLLANELEPDTGVVNNEIKISYKPQYIKPETNPLVRDVLYKNPLYSTYKHYFRHLNIEPLMNKHIQDLSGGELQRVSITNCLTQDAELYLLDEPSAHLDVEQRIFVAKALKEITRARKKNALVIDHDLMFIDYVSERLLVFKGKPAINGESVGPLSMREGMNTFLKDLGITFRRDESTGRPRPNKDGSVKDREQKEKGEYYY